MSSATAVVYPIPLRRESPPRSGHFGTLRQWHFYGAGAGGRQGERKAIVRRRLVPLLLVAAVLLLFGGVAARAEAVDAEGAFVARIAQERAAQGLPGLPVASDLQAVARRHAHRMADQGTKFHNPNLGSEVDNWLLLAENVGFGPTVEDLHQAFMASAPHRANILNGDVTQVGIGAVHAGDGRLYVVQVFRLPAGSAPAARPPTTTPPPATAAPPTTQPPQLPAPAAPAPTTIPPPPTVPEPLPATGTGELAAPRPRWSC